MNCYEKLLLAAVFNADALSLLACNSVLRWQEVLLGEELGGVDIFPRLLPNQGG